MLRQDVVVISLVLVQVGLFVLRAPKVLRSNLSKREIRIFLSAVRNNITAIGQLTLGLSIAVLSQY